MVLTMATFSDAFMKQNDQNSLSLSLGTAQKSVQNLSDACVRNGNPNPRP